jgi:hypothetical protein
MPDSLAEIVIAEGLLTTSEVAQAANSADSARIPLVVPVVRDHGVDEVALVAALRKHVRVAVLDPGKIDFDSDALREISLHDSRRLRSLAISIGIYGSGPRLLRVAMADPTDAVSIAELEHISGCTVEPALVTLSAVEEMIESAYKHFVTEVMKRSEIVQTPKPSKKSAGRPKTQPFHRIADEAAVSVRVDALVQLCVKKGVFEQGEYEAAVKALLKKPKSKS